MGDRVRLRAHRWRRVTGLGTGVFLAIFQIVLPSLSVTEGGESPGAPSPSPAVPSPAAPSPAAPSPATMGEELAPAAPVPLPLRPVSAAAAGSLWPDLALPSDRQAFLQAINHSLTYLGTPKAAADYDMYEREFQDQ